MREQRKFRRVHSGRVIPIPNGTGVVKFNVGLMFGGWRGESGGMERDGKKGELYDDGRSYGMLNK